MKVQWTAIDVRLLDSGRVRLLSPVMYGFENGLAITVPAGYECDLASVPFPFNALLPNKVKSSPGAVLHDRCYSHAEEVQAEIRSAGVFSDFALTRGISDGLANYVWNAAPATRYVNGVYWAGVRIGGARAWAKHRAARERERLHA